MASNRAGRGTGVVFLLVGIVFFIGLAVAATIVGLNEHRQADWPVTDGEIVDVVKREISSRDSDGRTTRTRTTVLPVVKFSVDGKDYQFTSSGGSGDRSQIGRTVEVRYNPDDPQQASLAGGLVWVVVLLAGVGVAFLGIFGGIGVGLLRSAGRRARQSRPWLS